MFDMRRREFVTLLGGAAAAWPLAARAQQSAMPVIGFLSSLPPSELTFVMPAFHQGLNAAGFVDGRNIAIEYRCIDLVSRQVAVIAAISGTPAALAAKAATTTIPIVFAIGGDPVAPGLVTNLSRPGGNITGASFYTSPVVTKRLEMARELVPQGTLIATLVNPDNPPSVTEGTTLQEAGVTLGQAIQVLNASTEGHIEAAFAAIRPTSRPTSRPTFCRRVAARSSAA